MDDDMRQNHQEEPVIPPDVPPSSEYPPSKEFIQERGYEGETIDDEAVSEEERAQFIKRYGLKVWLMWQWLHDPNLGRDT